MQGAEGRHSEVGGREDHQGMVESRDELLMEIAKEIGLDCMGDDKDDEEEEDDGGDATTPSSPESPAAVPEEIYEEGPVEAIPEQEAPVPHEVVPADDEPMVPQLHLYHALIRDYE
jgi:hypothetical protein